jgi:hypothetical protein
MLYPLNEIFRSSFGFKEFSRAFVVFYLNFYRALFVVQFILACAVVKVRFSKLNENIKAHFPHNKRQKLDFKLIESSVKIHQNLSHCIKIVNEIFAFQLIGIFVGMIVSCSNRVKPISNRSHFLFRLALFSQVLELSTSFYVQVHSNLMLLSPIFMVFSTIFF